MASAVALQVSAAYKRYSSTSPPVLAGLNMTVERGSIYALLGPSGCGKTTLLGSIVGLNTLDSGTVLSFARKKSDIGYMPQNTALYMTLSIGETFEYYGSVFGLHPDLIEARSRQLAILLDLPPFRRIVETLSGGQQRRVSLAVALLHNPELLILDEPTVGLDPVLSDSIWQYLLKLSNEEKKTIIITTHYIEEAKHASKVGLMRGGVLLCEESPKDLMAKTETDSMENAFLKLSYKQETNKDELRLPYPKRSRMLPITERPGFFNRNCFRAELIKNGFFVWRNKPMLLFLFGLPLVVSVFFNMAIGHPPQGLQVAVLNKEVHHGISDCYKIHDHGCNLSLPLGCRLVRKLHSRGILLEEFDDMEKAVYATKKNKVWGIIEVPVNYTYSTLTRLTYNLKTKDPEVEASCINVWLDMSNQNIGQLLKYKIWSSYSAYMEDLYMDCGWPVESLHVPIRIGEPIYGEKEPNLNHYASPAIILLLIFYLPASYTIGVLVQEKLLGVLERSIVAGVNLIEIFVAHSVVQVILLGIQMSIAMYVVYIIYDSPFIGDPFSTALLLLLQGLSGLSFGFLISMIMNNMLQATYVSLGSLFSYLFLSGMVWPQAGIHYVLLWFQWLDPVSYSVEAMRALTAKGWPITHPLVLKGFISVGSWIILYCLLAHIVIRLRKGNAFAPP